MSNNSSVTNITCPKGWSHTGSGIYSPMPPSSIDQCYVATIILDAVFILGAVITLTSAGLKSKVDWNTRLVTLCIVLSYIFDFATIVHIISRTWLTHEQHILGGRMMRVQSAIWMVGGACFFGSLYVYMYSYFCYTKATVNNAYLTASKNSKRFGHFALSLGAIGFVVVSLICGLLLFQGENSIYRNGFWATNILEIYAILICWVIWPALMGPLSKDLKSITQRGVQRTKNQGVIVAAKTKRALFYYNTALTFIGLVGFVTFTTRVLYKPAEKLIVYQLPIYTVIFAPVLHCMMALMLVKKKNKKTIIASINPFESSGSNRSSHGQLFNTEINKIS